MMSNDLKHDVAEATAAPRIIQGGMGVAVSDWRLAKAVAQTGQLGVVSGTGLNVVCARRLQRGDPGGHVRRALAAFPVPAVAQRALDSYFVPGGIRPDQPFKAAPMPHLGAGGVAEMMVLGNFVEVFLAKEGHDGPIGVNYLEKLQIPTLPSILGAMIAGVDYVLMGAGVPRFIPGVLDRFAQGQAAELRIDIDGPPPEHPPVYRLDPAALFGGAAPRLRRPRFLAIISSATLAVTLARKSNGRVDGFVIENATAGGHNAPPRGQLQLSVRGEPIYGPRDTVDLDALRSLNLPFWMAGGFADPGKLVTALELGAAGIQVGTAFAFCEESGIEPQLKARILDASRAGPVGVFTDPIASPTGFPFKVLQVEGSLAEAQVYQGRSRRTCDLGYLRRCYQKPDGTVGYRCPAEPVEHYLAKGGDEADTPGRVCLCNALMATIGLGQIQRSGEAEPVLVTAGDDAEHLARFLKNGKHTYTAADVVSYLLGDARQQDATGREMTNDQPTSDMTEEKRALTQQNIAAPDGGGERGEMMQKVMVDQFGGPEVLRYTDCEMPQPGPGQVRLRITSIGMNHADLMARSGNYRLSSGSPPFTPGIEGGGVIEALGEGVNQSRKGERVILGLGFRRRREDGGSYCSHYVCDAEEAIVAPPQIPDEQLGAIWLPYLTAWGCLVWKQQMKPGDIVALPAASSSVALAAAQVVRQHGGIAIGMTTSEEKVEQIRALPGFAYDHLIVTKTGPGRQPWYNDLKRITRGHGVDIFFDPVGAGTYLETEIRCLAQGGTIYIYGLLGKPGHVDVQPLIRKYGSLRGWLLNEIGQSPDQLRRGCEEVLNGFATGAYVQHVAKAFKLSEAREAHEFMECGRHVGKLVITPD